MPSCKTYEINNREQGKAAQRDQSYRSCLVALLIFFFLCLILILSCKPWNTPNQRKYKNQDTEQQRHEERTKEATAASTAPRTTTATSPTENPLTENVVDVITKDYSNKPVKGSGSFERILLEIMTTKDEASPSTAPEEDTEYDMRTTTRETMRSAETAEKATGSSTLQLDAATENVANATASTSPIDDIVERNTTSPTEQITDHSFDKYYSSFGNVIMSSTRSNEENAVENSSTTPSLSSDLEESTSAKYSSDEHHFSEKSQLEFTTTSVTSSTSPTLADVEEDGNVRNSTDKFERLKVGAATDNIASSTTPNLSTEEISAKYLSGASYSATAERYTMNATSDVQWENTTNDYPTSVSYDRMTTTIEPMSRDETNVCETGYCRQIASRMLSYMNHSADPCDDFYEYACGGFEANPQLMDEDRRSRSYQRIAKQMMKEKRENVHSTFAMYYDSCVQYERTVNFSERARIASDALREVGKFYITSTWSGNPTDFTNLFAKLILRHSAFLFDVVPELDEYHPSSFTLKIGPTTYESPFKAEHAEDPCSEDEFEPNRNYVDLEALYDNYKKCKSDTREFTRSVKEALTVLRVFKGLNDSYLEWNIESEHIEKTVHVVDSIIMQGYFTHFPSKSDTRETYLMNNYSKISLEKLQSKSAFVNWTQLIRSLTEMNVITSADVQVYFSDALIKGLLRLEEFVKEDPMGLNNAIMALYAHKLYHELVLSRRDNVKHHCLQAAAYLLRLEASSLYISSFVDREIEQMNGITKKIFSELKQRLKSTIIEAQWAKEEGQQALLKKIDSLELVLPAVSYFKNRDSLYSEYNVSQIILYDNYFNNSMILLKRYRTLIYGELRRQIDNSKQIWTYYVTPFQSQARVFYGLNLIVIPYGIVDWSSISDNRSFDYLLLATLGNLIAHQIAHHFDVLGIHYWDQIRNTKLSLMYENDFTETNFDDYIACQKENLYQGPMNMTLPFTDQIVSFTIPRLSLNGRLSEMTGLRLTYDTLAHTRSDAEMRLPWTKLRINQLFYLAYAQTYCTKTPLTSSYVALHESEDLPGRVRVFVAASNDQLLAEAWHCPRGSQVAPSDACSVFPYIDFKETGGLVPQ